MRKVTTTRRRPARAGALQGARESPGRRPEVIVDFLFEEGLLFIAVENIGDGPAIDASVEFDKKLRGAGGRQDVSSLPLFRRIRFLAPRRRITTFFDSSGAYFARREPTDVSARITYADSAGRRYEEVIRHDLEIYRDIGYVRRSPGPPDMA